MTSNDTYVFKPGDGRDTVIDSDGNGSLVVGNKTLNGATSPSSIQAGKRVWKSGSGGGEVPCPLQADGSTMVTLKLECANGEAWRLTA